MKQNVNNKLAFNKSAITELNETLLIEINGGSTIVGGETCTGCVCYDVSIKVSIVKTIVAAEF